MVPSFFHQEVLNALLTGERRNRITAATADDFIADILKLPIRPVSPDVSLVAAIADLSREHGLTAYDATPLASFDKALLRASVAEEIPAV
jgi:predicted nucleic acid-binding protein